jgi:hypothetical protein
LAQDKLMSTAQNGVGFKSSLVILKTSSFTEDINQKVTPRKYMTDDQRFAARRPDVVYETEILKDNMTLADIFGTIQVSTSGTDSDWIVK